MKKWPGNLKSEPSYCGLFFLVLSHRGEEVGGTSSECPHGVICSLPPDTPERCPELGKDSCALVYTSGVAVKASVS